MNPPQNRPVRFCSYESSPLEKPVSIGDWVLTLIVLGLPILNVILYIYWALSDSTPLSKKNYCRACILIFAIVVAASVMFAILAAVFAAIFASR